MKRLVSGCMTFALAAVLASCAGGMQEEPERALSSASAQVANNDRLAFQGHTEIRTGLGIPANTKEFVGVFRSKDELYIRPIDGSAAQSNPNGGETANDAWIKANGLNAWSLGFGTESEWNPRAAIDTLSRVKHSTEWDRKASVASGTRVLVSTADTEDWKKAVVEGWNKQLDRMTAQEHKQGDAKASSLGAGRAEAFKRDIDQAAEKTRRRLADAAASLQAQGTYRIALDNGTGKPTEMTVTGVYRYRLDGSDREETVVTRYVFTEDGSQVLLPSS